MKLFAMFMFVLLSFGALVEASPRDETPVIKGTPSTPQLANSSSDHETAGAIAGIERAIEKYDTSHPSDDSNQKVAWFTGMLVLVSFGQLYLIFRTLKETKIAAKAAEVAANAATASAKTQVAIELPIFVIEEVDLRQSVPNCTIKFGNHGRTPAIVKADYLEFKMAQALPDERRYPMSGNNELTQDRVVGAGQSYRLTRATGLTPDDWEAILKSNTILWAYGFIVYLDFLKREHREGFCIAFEPTANDAVRLVTWSRRGPSAYTYNEAD